MGWRSASMRPGGIWKAVQPAHQISKTLGAGSGENPHHKKHTLKETKQTNESLCQERRIIRVGMANI